MTDIFAPIKTLCGLIIAFHLSWLRNFRTKTEYSQAIASWNCPSFLVSCVCMSENECYSFDDNHFSSWHTRSINGQPSALSTLETVDPEGDSINFLLMFSMLFMIRIWRISHSFYWSHKNNEWQWMAMGYRREKIYKYIQYKIYIRIKYQWIFRKCSNSNRTITDIITSTYLLELSFSFRSTIK